MAFLAPADLARKLPLAALLGQGGGPSAERFWSQYRLHRPDHPLFCDLDADLSTVFPYALHGDEGAGLAEVPTLVVSWQPLLCFKETKTEWAKRYLIAVCPQRKMSTNTLGEVLAEVAREWSPRLFPGFGSSVSCHWLSGALSSSWVWMCRMEMPRNEFVGSWSPTRGIGNSRCSCVQCCS